MINFVVRVNGVYRFSFSGHFALTCATSTRIVDLGFQNNPAFELKEKRRDFLERLGIDYAKLILPEQVHKETVVLAKEQDKGRGALDYKSTMPFADGLITNQKFLPLGILTADCLPIFLYAPDTHSIGIVHAGWRGTAGSIAQNAVKALCKEFNSRLSEIFVGFGPGIGPCHYEVTDELKDYFPGELELKGGRLYLDLVKINIRQLLETGIRPERIFDSRLCTLCNNADFFSYRKEGSGVGRMMSVTMLR